MNDNVKQITQKIADKSIEESITILCNEFNNRVVFSTSFGLEDQVLTHIIFSNRLPVKVFTLDTGRMFPETYSAFSKTLEKYEQKIEVYFPESADVQDLMTRKGPFSFYQSVEQRKECCNIRKIKPLKIALKGNSIWITGLRSDQSENRNKTNLIEWDEHNQIIKYNPLLKWSFDEVREFIKKNQIPYNLLHDQGYPSIGCQPCTRKVKDGEDFRAGRWWWEHNSGKECGLHSS